VRLKNTNIATTKDQIQICAKNHNASFISVDIVGPPLMNQTNVKNYYLIGIIGICVTRASSSVNMCIKLTQFRPDNVVLDIKMAGM